MMNDQKIKLSLDRPAIYQIKVPGQIDLSQADWVIDLEISYKVYPEVTVLTDTFDQSALLGLLHQLNSPCCTHV